MKFEDLLEGKKLHELTDEEIEEIIRKGSREDLEKLEREARKSVRKTKSKTSIAAEKRKMEEFNKIILGAL